MRWLFLLMVILNLSYITWAMTKTVPTPAAVNRPGVPTIRLLSEEPPDKKIVAAPETSIKPLALAKVTAQPEPVVKAEQVSNNIVDKVDVSAKNTTSLRHQKQTHAAEDNGSESVENATDEGRRSKAVAQQPITKKAGHEETKSVVTAKVNSQVKASAVGPARVIPEVVPASPASCYSLGPFRDQKKVHSLSRAIKPYVVETSFHHREEKSPFLFWVYLKPLTSRERAKKISKQLKVKGIKDFYIIRAGVKNNGISLGRFKKRRGAYALAKKVKQRGFNVAVEVIFKTYTLFWLDYSLPVGQSVPKAIFENQLPVKSHPLKHACKG